MISLAEILVLRGLMPIETMDTLGSSTAGDKFLIDELMAGGHVTDSQVASARAAQLGIPFVELTDYPVDRKAVEMVPTALLRRHEVLPIAVDSNRLTIAMADPGDVIALDDVRASVHILVQPVLAELGDLRTALARFVRSDGELSDLTTAIVDEASLADSGSMQFVEASDEDAPVVRFVNLLISQGIQDHASDIHIEPGEHELTVRYRIDGVLHIMQRAPKNIQNGVISRLKIMSDIDIAERRRPQDGRMSVRHAERKIDLRVATLPTVWGEKVVMRILDNTNTSMHIEELGLLPRNADVFKQSYTKPNGMILVTGPTGSGKSTTLYTTLKAVARPEINVITVEDPVEYRMPGINQVQVNNKAGLTFASALRSILRSDPDVVLLGEIRDHESAQIAIEASLTGHLVLSTLHTNDAPSAITRLIEMDIEPFLVGSALDSVMAQRLARRLCDRCKTPYQSKAEDIMHLRVGYEPAMPPPVLYAPVGCASCSNTGYRGRIAIHEIMPVTEEIERLSVARASSLEITQVAIAQGMATLRVDGWEKAQMGLTSIEEVLRVVA